MSFGIRLIPIRLATQTAVLIKSKCSAMSMGSPLAILASMFSARTQQAAKRRTSYNRISLNLSSPPWTCDYYSLPQLAGS
jgi:hypothetical protein